MPLYDVILYVLLLALAIAVIAAMFAGAMALKQENPFSWPVIVGLAMIGFLITRPVEYQPGPLDRAIAASLAPAPKPRTLQQAIQEDCPPAAPGHTAQIIFTVETESDTQPRVTGCSRIAEQQYIVGARK
jgi:hypothetical protein